MSYPANRGGPSPEVGHSRLAIVCPMANEKNTAVAFVGEMLAEASVFKEVLFIAILDRVSTDGTLELLRNLAEQEPRLRVVWAPQNRCVVDAYTAGYRAGLATGFEWILEVDAGYSHKPSDLSNFLPHVRADIDCVFGSRFCPGGRISNSSFKRLLLSRGGTIFTNLLLGTRLKDMTSGYQLFQRHALEQVLAHGLASRGHFFQTEMKVRSRKMRVVEVPIHYQFASNSVGRHSLVDAAVCLGSLVRQRITSAL